MSPEFLLKLTSATSATKLPKDSTTAMPRVCPAGSGFPHAPFSAANSSTPRWRGAFSSSLRRNSNESLPVARANSSIVRQGGLRIKRETDQPIQARSSFANRQPCASACPWHCRWHCRSRARSPERSAANARQHWKDTVMTEANEQQLEQQPHHPLIFAEP